MRVLLISNVFPPKTSTRAIQVFRLASGLAELGPEVHVLTRGLRTSRGAYPFELHALAPPATDPPGRGPRAPRLRHVQVAWSRLRARRRWIRDVARFAEPHLAGLGFHVVLSFSNPFENHQAARSVLRTLGHPRWLAYWSDPWPSTLQCGPYRRSSVLAPLLYEPLARRTLREAHASLFPSHVLRRHFESRLVVDLRERSHILPHIGTRSAAGTVAEVDRGWITHLGTLDRERVHPNLVSAVLRTAEALGPERFRGLRLIGKVGRGLHRVVEALGAHRAVRVEPRVPPNEVAGVVGSSHALLVVEAPMDRSVYSPSKFAEYALSRRPILTVSPRDSALRDTVRRLGGSPRVAFCEYDEDEIYRALCTIFGAAGRPEGRIGPDGTEEALSDHYSGARICSDLKDFMETTVEHA